MAQEKSLGEQRQELYDKYENRVKRFIFCYSLIKRDPKKERVVLRKGGKEIRRTYNIEIIIVLLILKWFSAYSPECKKTLSNGDLITIWGIAFDKDCPYHIKGSKKLLEIRPDDYINCYYPKGSKKLLAIRLDGYIKYYYPKRRTIFDKDKLKRTSFHKLAAYVSYEMFFDYFEIFLEKIQHEGMQALRNWTLDYGYRDFFHNSFIGFINTLRLKTETINQLKRNYNLTIEKSRKEDGYNVIKKINESHLTEKAKKIFQNIKNPGPDESRDEYLYFCDVEYDYGLWKYLCENKKTIVNDHLHDRVKWEYLDIDYEIQALNQK